MSDQTPKLFVMVPGTTGGLTGVHSGQVGTRRATHTEMFLAAGLVTVCETCKRTPGLVRMAGNKVVSDALGWTLAESSPCPDCDARGWLLDPDRLEVSADVLEIHLPEVVKPYALRMVETVLLAYMK